MQMQMQMPKRKKKEKEKQNKTKQKQQPTKQTKKQTKKQPNKQTNKAANLFTLISESPKQSNLQLHLLCSVCLRNQPKILIRDDKNMIDINNSFHKIFNRVIWTFGLKVMANLVKSLWICLVWPRRNPVGR